jgi:hypothetical protein
LRCGVVLAAPVGQQRVDVAAQLPELLGHQLLQRTHPQREVLGHRRCQVRVPSVGEPDLLVDGGQTLVELAGLGPQVADAPHGVNPPVDWMALTAGQAAEQWPILAAWIGEVLVPWCEWTRNELPDCWALHRPVVVELSWLRSTHVAAYLPKAPAQLAAEWHTRWRPASLTGIKEAMKSTECGLGKHTSRCRPPLQVDVPAGETAATRAKLAVPKFWWPFYARAVDEDLAARHARAGAARPDWFPPPAGSSG